MGFNFPSSPAENELFTPPGGPQYVYKAPAWRVSGKVDSIVSPTPPIATKPGQLWFNSATGNTYIWYDDGNSAQWVQINVAAGDTGAGGTTTPEAYGAVGDGVTDDSAAFAAALAASSYVKGSNGKVYVVKDLVISGSKVLDMQHGILDSASGAKWIVRLTGYEPRLINTRMRDSPKNVIRSTVLGAGAAALATSFTVASATGLEVGMLATVKMDNQRWHISPITAIAGTVITVCRAFETTAASGAAVDCSWGMVNVRGAYRYTLSDINCGNVGFGVVQDADPAAGLSYATLRGTVEGLTLVSVTHVGLFSGRNCADTRYERMSIRGGVTETLNAAGDGVTAVYNLATPAWLKSDVTVSVAGVSKTQPAHWTFVTPSQIQFTGGNIPTAGQAIVIHNAIDAKAGIVIDATGWTDIRGGDTYSIVESLGFWRGLEMHNKELTSFNQLTCDTCSGEGAYIDTCVHQVTFQDAFLGYSNCPLKVVGATNEVFFMGPLYTMQPSGSSLASGAAAAYAVDVAAGATLTINATQWQQSSVKKCSLTGTFVFLGSSTWNVTAEATVATGAPVYFTPTGTTTSASRGYWMAQRDGMRLVRMYMASGSAPGAGKTFTFTVTVNGVDTALVGSYAETGVFGFEVAGDIALSKNDRVQVRFDSTAGAAVTAFRGYIEVI